MALLIGIFLGIFLAHLFRLHQKNALGASLGAFLMTLGCFVVMTALYYWAKKDPFDHIFGLQRYRTDWDNILGAGTSKVWGPTETDWGPPEQHWSTATGLNFSRYLMGYLGIFGAAYAYYLARRSDQPKALQEIEYFYENGKIKEKGKLKYGFKDGVWEFYDQEGVLIRKALFQEGEYIEDIKI